MKKVVYSFKFTRSDLIQRLKASGITQWDAKCFEQAMKKDSLTAAVDHVLINSVLLRINMLVYQTNRSCNCCGNMVETSIVDLPLEEVKLAPFAVACACGYFYEALHYSVSFSKWNVFRSKLLSDKKYLKDGIKLEEDFLKELPTSDYSKKKIIEYKERLEIVLSKLKHNSTPIPDHLWVD